MALVAHTIRSYLDPPDHDKLEHETGQLNEDQSDPWQTESSFSAQRRTHGAPSFVPATLSYDEWGFPLQSTFLSSNTSKNPDKLSSSNAEWYRSLTVAASSHLNSKPPPRPSSAPNAPSAIEPSPQPRREIVTKNNWFITKALRSEPSTKSSSPAPSLADLLARDPPPLPSEMQYTPPVWLHIGPSNKGFSMLQRSGWNEGEGLGAHVLRPLPDTMEDCLKSSVRQSVRLTNISSAKVEEMESGTQKIPEVIDLTQSDFEDEPEDGFEALRNAVPQRPLSTQTSGASAAPHMQKTLLAPLPIVLKADRLGIGLKVKTEGPHKRSKKRVTHNAAALAAHTRAAEEMRRKKVEVGRGERGFAKIRKGEEDRRKLMLAYLNE
ncbi:hypothetical protein PAXRUDRAFT_830662 [Paxillus rubicundulus Ve08.2h10]|uniref:G-patch domain-containing protein n=1 Tax=Paxillus rubicundulus Ve08.2h10 TaxID=930991 RepID=A0A0D0DT54_9AGAM|nr:hypothetical protein PAXRUDRAFT_830662 [Paxillus rubicundulus Ve08.2h10]